MKKIIRKLIYTLIILLQFIIIINYNKDYYIKQLIKIEKNSIEYMLNKNNSHNTINDIKEKTKEIRNDKIIKYNMIIEIPKINLKKGILNKDDKDNIIEKNVMITKESSLPNENGNIFLAAHSGTSKRSYFKNIDKLKESDKAFIYYNNKKYKYIVEEKYEQTKNASLLIKAETLNNLYLITCSQTNKNNYLIIRLKKTDI